MWRYFFLKKRKQHKIDKKRKNINCIKITHYFQENTIYV